MLIFSKWIIIELSRNPEKQDTLRKELSLLSGQDPSFDDLQNGLPYLDAVIQETLRVHSPVIETYRIVSCSHIRHATLPTLRLMQR